MHKGEECCFPERSEDFSVTSFTRRTIPFDVCGVHHGNTFNEVFL